MGAVSKTICFVLICTQLQFAKLELLPIGNYVNGDGMQSQYFQSQNAAGWATSGKDCEALGMHLVRLETKAEAAEFASILFRSNFSGSSWTGGLFTKQNGHGQFQWADGTPIAKWLMWGRGQPSLKSRIAKLAVYKEGTFHTRFQTESLRAICELENPTNVYA